MWMLASPGPHGTTNAYPTDQRGEQPNGLTPKGGACRNVLGFAGQGMIAARNPINSSLKSRIDKFKRELGQDDMKEKSFAQ